MEGLRAFGGEREHARRIECRQAIRQSIMHAQARKLVIIQPGAKQLFILQREAERFDQMQLATGIGAQADDIAGVRRNLRLVQNHAKHKVPIKIPAKSLKSEYAKSKPSFIVPMLRVVMNNFYPGTGMRSVSLLTYK